MNPTMQERIHIQSRQKIIESAIKEYNTVSIKHQHMYDKLQFLCYHNPTLLKSRNLRSLNESDAIALQ